MIRQPCTHNVTLNEPFFDEMRDGFKRYEGRCRWKKALEWHVGDTLRIKRYKSESKETFRVIIQAIHSFATFREALTKLPLHKVLPSAKSIDDGCNTYRRFVSDPTAIANGVLMFQVELVVDGPTLMFVKEYHKVHNQLLEFKQESDRIAEQLFTNGISAKSSKNARVSDRIPMEFSKIPTESEQILKQLVPARHLSGLWISDRTDASDPRVIRRLGIGAILTLSTQPLYNCHVLSYKHIHMEDDAKQLPSMPEMLQWIEQMMDKGLDVMVHCEDGRNRSAAIVARFLQHKMGWTGQEALAFMKQRRPIVSPNRALVHQLCRHDAQRLKRRNRPSL